MLSMGAAADTPLEQQARPVYGTVPAQRDVLAGTLVLSLLWAAAGFDQMVKGRPLDRIVNAVNAKSESQVYGEYTSSCFHRADPARPP